MRPQTLVFGALSLLSLAAQAAGPKDDGCSPKLKQLLGSPKDLKAAKDDRTRVRELFKECGNVPGNPGILQNKNICESIAPELVEVVLQISAQSKKSIEDLAAEFTLIVQKFPSEKIEEHFQLFVASYQFGVSVKDMMEQIELLQNTIRVQVRVRGASQEYRHIEPDEALMTFVNMARAKSTPEEWTSSLNQFAFFYPEADFATLNKAVMWSKSNYYVNVELLGRIGELKKLFVLKLRPTGFHMSDEKNVIEASLNDLLIIDQLIKITESTDEQFLQHFREYADLVQARSMDDVMAHYEETLQKIIEQSQKAAQAKMQQLPSQQQQGRASSGQMGAGTSMQRQYGGIDYSNFDKRGHRINTPTARHRDDPPKDSPKYPPAEKVPNDRRKM